MLTDYQTRQLETLFRQAVLLRVNPSGGPAPCEMLCGRIGEHAHHIVYRSQEPALRLKYEPRFAAWLCTTCHGMAHHSGDVFADCLIDLINRRNPAKANCLALYRERHDRLTAPSVPFAWMKAYLQRCVERASRNWSQIYNCDPIYSD